jgi:hypothetical protein
MNGKFHLAKLALPKIALDIIEIFNRRVPNCSLNACNPLTAIITVSAVKDSYLVDWEDHFKGINNSVSSAFKVLFFLRFNKDTDQTMHVLVSLIIFFLIAIEFFAKEAVPITFQFTFWGFTEKFTFKLGKLVINVSFIELEVIIYLGFRV